MNKIPIIAIIGPTASGKTAISIEVAKKFNGEIVSADSMQIYKKMNIGTAKPSAEEMQGIKHHMIDCIEIDENYSLADYVSNAHEIIADINSRGKLPILVGGTGLYVDTLLNDIVLNEFPSNPSIRQELENYAKENGVDSLFEILKDIDAESAKRIDKNNIPRVVRAIEVYKITGKTLTVHQLESRQNESRYNSLKIGLNYLDREVLYNRINLRVDKMIEDGLLDEAKEVFSHNLNTAMQAIGYKELALYLKNEQSLEEAIDKLKQNSRRYAKRQLTWFRKDEKIKWFYLDNIDKENEYENIKKNICNYIENFLHLCYY